MRPGLRGGSFALDKDKVSIDAETEIEPGFRLADRTSSVLVWWATLGSRARRFDRPKYEYFFLRLNSR